MSAAARVNFGCKVSSPTRREDVLRRLPDALDGAAIEFDVTDGEVGALGLPRWTTVWFHAAHGDYERLRCEVVERVERAGLSGAVVELSP